MKRTKQIAAGLFAVLSLFVSSVSACVCLHHAKKVETAAASCHEHAAPKLETGSAEERAGLDSRDKLDSRGECGCAPPAPRAVSKSGAIKIEKQAAVLPIFEPEFESIPAILPAEKHYFEKPFHLSDSFYNLKSPRAPPAA
ncbi:MAG TPA: hypothetical protein VIL74_18275 [Pyrinomonadaceae bacterium]